MRTGVVGVVCVILLSMRYAFGQYVSQGPFVSPMPGDGIPTPNQVPGKEYVDSPNVDQSGVETGEQELLWDGAGGVANGYNYAFSQPDSTMVGQVDGLANFNDELFAAVVSNQAALVYSLKGDPGGIAYNSESVEGEQATWATDEQVNSHGVTDAGDLEVWGPEGSPDANVYSLVGDPVNPKTGQRTCVWVYIPGQGSFPLYTAEDIADAIGHPELAGTIDVDALMANNGQLIFSIEPDGPFNGGEVWYWNPGSNPLEPNAAVFLDHGGHEWDTAFGADNGQIDGLEAVAIPEPTAAAMLLMMAIPLLMRNRNLLAGISVHI